MEGQKDDRRERMRESFKMLIVVSYITLGCAYVLHKASWWSWRNSIGLWVIVVLWMILGYLLEEL